MKINLALIILLQLLISSCKNENQFNRSYDESLDEFLEVSGQSFENNAMLSEFNSNKFFFSFYNQENKARYDSLYHSLEATMRPIYKKHYSQEELEELIRFFKSPIGKTYVEKNNKIAIEGIKISTEKSMELMKGILKKNDLIDPISEEKK